jgi:hypothetical protein
MWDFEFLCKAGLEICHVALIGIEKYQLQLMYQKTFSGDMQKIQKFF